MFWTNSPTDHNKAVMFHQKTIFNFFFLSICQLIEERNLTLQHQFTRRPLFSFQSYSTFQPVSTLLSNSDAPRGITTLFSFPCFSLASTSQSLYFPTYTIIHPCFSGEYSLFRHSVSKAIILYSTNSLKKPYYVIVTYSSVICQLSYIGLSCMIHMQP